MAAVVKDDRLRRVAESVGSVAQLRLGASQSGSKFGSISSASVSILNGTQSQIANNSFYVAK